MNFPLKRTSFKLTAFVVGAGLALTGVAAIQAPVPAEAATVSNVQTVTRAGACKTAKANYKKAKAANAKAVKKSIVVYNKAKKARHKSKATGTKYTTAASHKKLMKSVNKYYKQSKWKRMKATSLTCTTYAKAKGIDTVTARVKANTKRLNAATTKLSKNVNAYVKKPLAARTVTLKYNGGSLKVKVPAGVRVRYLTVKQRTALYRNGQIMYADDRLYTPVSTRFLARSETPTKEVPSADAFEWAFNWYKQYNCFDLML